MFSGELSKALKHVDDGLAFSGDSPTLGAELIGFSPHLLLLGFKGYALIYAGQPHDGATCLQRAIDLAHQHHDLTPLLASHTYFVTFAEVTGDMQTSLEHGRQCVDAAEKTGSPVARLCGYFALGHAHLLNGEWREAVSALDHALTIAHDHNTGLCWEAGILARLAWAYLSVGDHARSRQAAEEALAAARRRGTRLWEHHARLILARVLMRTEGAGAAGVIAATLSAAQASIEATGARSYEPFVHLERAELARLSGDDVTRRRELREAHRLFLEIGAPIRAAEVAGELAS